MVLKYFFATSYLGGATAYLVGGKMNPRIRLTSAKVGVEVEAELGNKYFDFLGHVLFQNLNL